MVKKLIKRRKKRGKPTGITVKRIVMNIRRSKDGRIMGFAKKPKRKKRR